MAAVLTLRSAYDPGPPGHGTIDLRLENAGADSIERFRLALTSTVRLDPGPDTGVQLVRQVSGYLELAPACRFRARTRRRAADHRPVGRPHPTSRQRRADERVRRARGRLDDRRPRRADDVSDQPRRGSTPEQRTVGARHRATRPRSCRGRPRSTDRWVGRVRVAGRVRGGAGAIGRAVAIRIGRGRRRLARGRPSGTASPSGRAVGARRRRRHRRGCLVGLGRHGRRGTRPLRGGDRRLDLRGGGRGERRGGLPARVRHGRPAAARRCRRARADRRRARRTSGAGSTSISPASSSRHPTSSGSSIWRRGASSNRLHLHLTDDEAWRVPIDGYPDLTTVGAWRGHGLPIPPLLGSPAAATGGSYTVDEIRGWVERARELGVVIVPEVDLPGHCHAALDGRAVAARSRRHDRGAQCAALRRQLALPGTADHDAVRRGRVRHAGGDVRLTVVARRR